MIAINARRKMIIKTIVLSLALNVIVLSSVKADSANVTLPASVSFSVSNTGLSTTGTPNPTTAEFSDAILSSGNGIRMGIQADSLNFSRPVEAGGYIPASNVSWTTSSAVNGTGFPGTLSATAFTLVFQGNADATFGSVNISWTLSAPGSNVRAGIHTLAATWKIESLAP